MLWLNLQVTQSVQHYRFADLEEATFYQYQYGQSTDVPKQAARFLSGFLEKAPFAEGNELTAAVAFHAYLALNGYTTQVVDADTLIRLGQNYAEPESLLIVAKPQDHDHGHDHDDVQSHRPTRAVLTDLLNELIPDRGRRS